MNYEQSLYGALIDTATRFPNEHALLFMGKYIDYGTLKDRVDKLSQGFAEMGIRQGDVVTLAMPNVFEAIFSLYALNRLGVVLHLVHPLTPTVQMKKFMDKTHSKHLVVLDTFFLHFKALLEDQTIRMILATPVSEFGLIKKVGYKLINRKKLKQIKPSDQVIYLADLMIAGNLEPAEVDSKETAFLLHSGGTSGEPKTIELSNRAINYLADQVPYIMGIEDLRNHHMLAVLPMFHGFGLCMGLHGMLMHGGVDALMPKFSADETIKLIKNNQCHFIIGVPSLFESLLRHPHFRCMEISHLKQAYVGGDYVAEDLKQRFDAVMQYYYSDARLLEGYGLTEAVTVCAVNTLEAHNPKSVGKSLPGIEVRIIDQELLTYVEPNVSGEIVVSGPTMMNGYLDDEEATQHTIIDIDGQKWIRTGDYGYIDNDNYVHFQQRLKRIVKVSGMPVLPAEIENFLMGYEAIQEVAAIGIPDAYKGHLIKLFVVWNKQVDPMSFTEIKALIKNNISRYAEPAEIVVMDELPKTFIGKIDVLELEKM